jgi:hypothetical protein
MRLWSLHPQYLDSQGLVALWREGLLAQKVLRGATRGYRHHPQLERFRLLRSPETAVARYLQAVADEAGARGYAFDRMRLLPTRRTLALTVTDGQLAFEWEHLMRKLRRRNPALHRRWRGVRQPSAHPLFTVTTGDIAPWERP